MNCCARICHLSVRFGGQPVLHDLSLDCPDKAITVLLGRSGSGKTTLLRSLNRLNDHFPECVTEGSVELKINGRLQPVLSGALPLSELRRKAGMVFQSPNPLPMSARRNITLPLSLVLGVKGGEAEDRMKRALLDVGLWDEISDRLDSPAGRLSGGQQQRLCLARTLALEPDLLLLDEPTASLDRKASAVVEELLLSLRERYPIVMVSHSLSQARKLAEYVAVLSGGALVKTLEASELPQGEEAEQFLEKLL